jgi:CRISPR-associated protein Csd1
MSALASLVRAYERLAGRGAAPKFGYARTPISFSIRIDREGRPTCPPIDLREAVGKGKKPVGRRIDVPTFLGQRTSGIDANFLWDKTQYILGINKPDPKKPSADQAKEASRALRTHEACIELHRKHLASETDEGLVAMLRFLERWKPEQFGGWTDEMKGENVVFELDGDRRFIHERPAARSIWLKVLAEEPAADATCLVEGTRSRVPLTHPPIKGVKDAQPSGAALVSFNLDAFTSYGHTQCENAPVSETAAFAYTTALNQFLEIDGGHRIQIGDASTVFWADASETDAIIVEGVFGALAGAETAREDERIAAQKIAAILESIRLGKP